MNYKQARQIGDDGPAPGKWNWSNLNDSIARSAYTIAPCATPEGRCDHDTAIEAERHHYDYELGRVELTAWVEETALERRRCDADGCSNWQTRMAIWPRGYIRDDICDDHGPGDVHLFVAGSSEIHS